MSEIHNWLEAHGLGEYTMVFAENDIDLAVLPELTDEELTGLGVSLGHRKKLRKALRELSRSPPSTASHSPAATSEPERRQLTVMFCDLVGSTALSASMDPEVYREVLVSYQDAAREAIGRYEGYIARYMGDGLLVYFGFPQAHEDDSERAVRAGLAIVDEVAALEPAGGVDLRVRIGIATGLVVAGDIVGEGASEERAVLGETPNLAARLQGIAEPNQVVLSGATRRLIEGRFILEALGDRAVKGIEGPIPAYRAVTVSAANRFEAAAVDGLTRMTGRESEIALLRQRWEQAAQGEGQVVLLGGEPGIGKSRVGEALRESVERGAAGVFRYQCSPYHSGSAFHPFIARLQRVAAFTRGDSAASRLRKLEAYVERSLPGIDIGAPMLAALMSLPIDRYALPEMTPQRQKAETIGVLVASIVREAARGPVLVIVEDAHWIDPSSQEVLDALVDEIRPREVLCLVTHRPGFSPSWAGAGNVTSLSLNRLGRHHVDDIVDSVSGGRALPDEVRAQIVARTDGVPLFVEELTKTVIEAGILEEVGGRYELVGPLPSLSIPATLHDSLLARLDRLDSTKEVAQIAACIGREFSADLLASASARAGDVLEADLVQLVAAGLLFRRGTGNRTRYVFKHALVQDTAYETLLVRRRKRVHARIACALEEHFPDVVGTEPERLAQHYEAADMPAEAIPHWIAAGRKALSSSSLAEAISHLSTALDLTARIDDGVARAERQLEVRTALGTATMALHGWPAREVRDVVQPACALFERGHGRVDAFMNFWNLWVHHGCRAEHHEGLAVVERMLEHAGTREEPVTSLISSFAASMASYWMGDYELAATHERAALELYEFERDRALVHSYNHDPKNTLLSWASQRVWARGYPDGARALADEAVAHARRVGNPFNLCWTLGNSSITLGFLGESDAAYSRIEELARIAREQGLLFMDAYMVPASVCVIAAQFGDYETVLEKGALAESTWRSIGGRFWSPVVRACMANAYLSLGYTDEAAEMIESTIGEMETTGELMLAEEIYRIAGLVRQRQSGGVEDAERLYRKSLDCSRRHGTRSFELRTATCLARLRIERGERQQARELLAPALAWFTEAKDTADLVEARAVLDELR